MCEQVPSAVFFLISDAGTSSSSTFVGTFRKENPCRSLPRFLYIYIYLRRYHAALDMFVKGQIETREASSVVSRPPQLSPRCRLKSTSVAVCPWRRRRRWKSGQTSLCVPETILLPCSQRMAAGTLFVCCPPPPRESQRGPFFNCSSSNKSLSAASLLAALEARRSLPANALQPGLRGGDSVELAFFVPL